MAEVKTIGVSIVDFMFGRANVTIDAGDTVTWTVNFGTHTRTSTSGLWNSGSRSTGQGFSFTFDHAGSYPYFCSIHPFMTATIAVEG